jgi:hypothetical protein
LEIAGLQQPGKTDFAAIPPKLREAREKLQAARQKLVDIESKVQTVAMMDETPTPRPTWILPRGVYSTPHTPENDLTRNTFSQILPPFPAEAPRDRLGLAKWLTQPDHPLTSRVFVNRVWQHFFGTGLVPTSDNFGFQGTAPSHPELLDWIARDFVSHGWDVKRLCRQIVLFATYRQDSRMRPELREKAPANILLARRPARRLAAEPSRALAEVVLRAHPDARIRAAFLRLAGRQPDSRELDLLNQLLAQQLDVFKAKPDDAKAFLKIGEKSPDASIDPAVLAANTVLCQTILNLDAVIWNR